MINGVIIALLEKNGVKLVKGKGPIDIKPQEGISALLAIVLTAVKAAISQGCPIAFVMDIDSHVNDRWQSICSRLEDFSGLKELLPKEMPKGGVIIPYQGINIGFWLMPDNQKEKGMLEDLLESLITPQEQVLYDQAKGFVNDVKQNFVAQADRFKDIDIKKAYLATWLGVKNPPGMPYGVAIKSRCFDPSHPNAKAFMTWIKSVYNL